MFEGSGDLIALERIRLSNRASLESSNVERLTEHEYELSTEKAEG